MVLVEGGLLQMRIGSVLHWCQEHRIWPYKQLSHIILKNKRHILTNDFERQYEGRKENQD